MQRCHEEQGARSKGARLSPLENYMVQGERKEFEPLFRGRAQLHQLQGRPVTRKWVSMLRGSVAKQIFFAASPLSLNFVDLDRISAKQITSIYPSPPPPPTS